MSIELIHQGNNAFHLGIDGSSSAEAKTILINPVLNGRSVSEYVAKHPVHYILMTHLYPQWKDTLSFVMELPGVTLVAQKSLSDFLQRQMGETELNVITMSPGHELDFPWSGFPGSGAIGSLVMTEVPEWEGSTYYFPNSSETYEPNGFILNAEGHQIYYSGPMPFHTELKSIGLTYKPDVTVLTLDESLGFGVEETARSVMWLGSDIVLPVVSSTSNNATLTIESVFSSIDIYTAAICRVLEPGQSYMLEPTASSGRSSGPETRY